MQTNTETVNTRSIAGRTELDAKILATLKRRKEPAASSDIVTATGASVLQVRASLHRLIAGGKVAASGNTRATRYVFDAS